MTIEKLNKEANNDLNINLMTDSLKRDTPHTFVTSCSNGVKLIKVSNSFMNQSFIFCKLAVKFGV